MYVKKRSFSWSSTHINMPVVINFLRTVRYLHTHEMAARLAFYYYWNIFTARKKLLRTYNLWKIFYNWAPKAQKFWHFMSKIPYFRILSWEWAHKTEGLPWGGTPKKPIFRNWGGGHPKPPPLNPSLPHTSQHCGFSPVLFKESKLFRAWNTIKWANRKDTTIWTSKHIL